MSRRSAGKAGAGAGGTLLDAWAQTTSRGGPQTRSKGSAIATPAEPSTLKAEKRPQTETEKPRKRVRSEYQPALHAVVLYDGEGKRTLDPVVDKLYEFVKECCIIPVDIETTRFGPLSGTCFEERVVTAYFRGKLKAKRGKDSVAATKICRTCATKGHEADDCTTLYGASVLAASEPAQG